MIARPAPSEHADYYATYIDKVPDGDVLETLETQIEATARVLAAVPSEAENFAYAPGKWSFREVMRHLIDAEWLFTFRCLHIARGDPASMPGMDQEVWTEAAGTGRSLAALMRDFRAVRAASLSLFDSLDPAVHTVTGIASNCSFSVRSFPWIVAGHELHHRGLIEDLYLPALEEAS